MEFFELVKQIDKCYENVDADSSELICPMPNLMLVKRTDITKLETTIYEPVLCLILQGEKETTIGGEIIRFGPGQSLIVSHRIPVVSRITQASTESPYIAMIVSIDIDMLRSLYHEIGQLPTGNKETTVANMGTTGQKLIDAMSRYLALVNEEEDQKIMTPMILKEIHFRLLMEPHGAMLQKLMLHDSYASQINNAIMYLKTHYKSNISVSNMAKIAGMSESSFYDNFKKMTATTPLQYQKELRLIEAQHLLWQETSNVSSVAFEVGYESSSQFSREYARKFGYPPRQEMSKIL